MFEDNINADDVDAVEIVSIDIGGGPLAVGAGVATTALDFGTLTVGDTGVAGRNISFDASNYDFLSFGQSRDIDFTYTARDAANVTDTASVTVRIIGLNDQPDAVDDEFGTPGNPPVPFLESATLNGDVLANDSDIDQLDMLSVTAVNGGGIGGAITLSNGTLNMGSNGAFSYVYTGPDLASGATFTETFQYTATDSAVAGFELSDNATVTIVVTGTNTNPVAVDDAFTAAEDVVLNGDVTPAIPGQDSDADGDAIVVSQVNGAAIGGAIALASGASVTMNADGSFNYNQNGIFDGLQAGQTGNDSFQYTISDGNGGTDTATATITINGANDDPIAVDDTYSVAEDASLNRDVTPALAGQDRDPDGDTIVVSQVNGAAIGGAIALASGASVTMNANGTFVYNQNGAFNGLQVGQIGNDSFQYTISDGNGGTDTATASIRINGENDAPIAVDDTFSVAEGASLNRDVTPALAGQDRDPDGDVIVVTQVNGAAIGGAIALASGASVTMNADGAFVYDQNGAFSGLATGATATDTFDYTISDGNGGTDTATASITVTSTNAAPIAVDDNFSVNRGNGLDRDVTPGTVGQDSDPNGDVINVVSVNGGGIGGPIALASGASVNMNADGTFSYSQQGAFDFLNLGQSAQDSFQYTISDGKGGTDTATASINVTAVNDPPTVTNNGADLLVGCKTLVSFNLLSAVDPEGAPRGQLVYTVQSTPAGGGTFTFRGVALVAGDTFSQGQLDLGFVSFQHSGAAGPFALGLTVSDPQGATTAPFDFVVTVKNPDELIVGTNNQDNLFGGNGDSKIIGLGANDGLFGHGGDDCLQGGNRQ